MNQRGIIHPNLLPHVQPGFYPSLCTIRVSMAVQDEYGQIIEQDVDLPGHVNIPCRRAPLRSQERRELLQIYAEATHHIALNGHYPGIYSAMYAVVDGTRYQIEGPPQHDGNDMTTRIYVREVM